VNTTPRTDPGSTRPHKLRPVDFFISITWSTGEGGHGSEASYWEVKDSADYIPEDVAASGAVPFDGDVEAARKAVREAIEAAGWKIQGDIEDALTWKGMIDHPAWDASCMATREGVES